MSLLFGPQFLRLVGGLGPKQTHPFRLPDLCDIVAIHLLYRNGGQINEENQETFVISHIFTLYDYLLFFTVVFIF